MIENPLIHKKILLMTRNNENEGWLDEYVTSFGAIPIFDLFASYVTMDEVLASTRPDAAITHIVSQRDADLVLNSQYRGILVARIRASGGSADLVKVTDELDKAGINLLLGVEVDKRGELLVDRLRACLVRAVTGVIPQGFTFEREEMNPSDMQYQEEVFS